MLEGRESEIREARRALAGLGACLLVGPPGIGKSAIVGALTADVDHVRVGQCLPALAHLTYGPLEQTVGTLPGVSEPEAVADELCRRLTPDDTLVVEDLHWSDRDSLAVVLHLIGRRRLLLTLRSGSDRAAGVAELVRSAGGRVIDVPPLSDEASADAVRALRPDLLEGERRRIVRESSGHPLVLQVLAQSDVDRSPGPVATPEISIISATVGRLSPAALFDLALMGMAPGPLPRTSLGAPDELESSGLVRPVNGGWEPLHRLFSEAAFGRVSDEDRRALHQRLAELADDDLLGRAHHLLAAGRSEEALGVALFAVESPSTHAAHAAALLAAAQAAMTVSDEQVHAAGFPGRRDQLTLSAAVAANDLGNYAAALDLIGDPERFERSERTLAACELVRAAIGVGAADDLLEWVVSVSSPLVDATNEEAVRLRLLLERMTAARPVPVGDLRSEPVTAGRIPSGTDRPGAGVPAAAALVGMVLDGREVRDLSEWLLATRAVVEATDDIATEFEAARNLIGVHLALGQLAEARELAIGGQLRAQQNGLDAWFVEFRTLEMMGRFYDDVDQDEALTWFSEVRFAPVRFETRALATSVLAALLADLGIDERSERVIRPWIDTGALRSCEPLTRALILWGAIQRSWVLGELDETIRLGRLVEELLPEGFPTTAGSLVAWRWAEFESGRPLTAPDPTGGLLPAAALEAAAIAALADGRPEAAAHSFLEAADSWATVMFRCSLRCRWGAGLALVASERHEAAVEVLERVDRDLDRAGMPALRARVAAAFRAAGVSAPTALGAADGVLSEREREVLQLVAEGKRTREIARRLGLSVHTVDSHVRSAVRKLGARSRVEAAARVATG